MLISTSAIPAKGYLLVMVQDDSMSKSLQQPFFYLQKRNQNPDYVQVGTWMRKSNSFLVG